MTRERYFFCGVGGSGMLPLAEIVKARGGEVAGSDRAFDQGRTPEKFEGLRARGIALFPQDGSGIVDADQILVTSAAVEDSIPDVAKARAIGCREVRRAELNAELFNAARASIGVAGTSGKSTVTAMAGWILAEAGRDPTIMNGAAMKNFGGASARIGGSDAFVSEVDESDGSIALYRPSVAVLGNISLDHKPLEELRSLFAAFVSKAECAVINLDDANAAALVALLPEGVALTYGIDRMNAYLRAEEVTERPDGIDFAVIERADGARADVALPVPGRHNVANALAAIGAARAAGVGLAEAARALGGFAGIKRRLEQVGAAGGVTVIDDFAHNPDKVAATLATLHAFPGRLLLLFQPHGYGPLKVLLDPLAAAFRDGLGRDDRLIVTDPAYYGGTTDRTIGSADLVAAIGGQAEHIAAREAAGERLLALAAPGDRIVVMGARDDTLSVFAADMLERLSSWPEPGPG